MTDWRHYWRLAVVLLAVAAGFAGLGGRLAFLHLGENASLHERIRKARRVEHPIQIARGRILDRHGNILAMDLAVSDVCADPSLIQEEGYVDFIGSYLARFLQLDPATVTASLGRPGRRFAYIKRNVSDDLTARLKALKLSPRHVWFAPVSVRHYPAGNLMAHAIGFANVEQVGSAGIELYGDKYLRGRPGLRVSERDGKKREIVNRRSLEIAPQPGADIELTLDMHLQEMVEEALDNAMREHRAQGAWAIVQRVKTGEILALASRPDYDLNAFRTAQDPERLNRAIGYVFEPGSTFKITVVAAALNEGLVTPDTMINCENGRWIYKGRPLRDFHPYGMLSVADVIKKSSNIGAAKIALVLGEERLEKYLREFGVGRPLGIELPGEEGGILHPRKRWTSLSITRIPMGHEVGVTALQVLDIMCSIANDGFLMRPAAVRRIAHPQGGEVYAFEPQVLTRPVKPETARTMLRLLQRVTEPGGTGRHAVFAGYTAAGKTGTAQKPVAGGYSDERNIASFVGVVPAEDPAIGIVVVVDEPQPLHTGGAVAAPVFRAIAEQAVRYLDIPASGRVEAIDPVMETVEDVPEG